MENDTNVVLVENFFSSFSYIKMMIEKENFSSVEMKLHSLEVDGQLSKEEIATLKIDLKKAIEEKKSRSRYGTRSRVFYPTYGKSGPNGPRYGNGHT